MKCKKLLFIFIFGTIIFCFQDCNSKFNVDKNDYSSSITEKFNDLSDKIREVIPQTYDAFFEFLAKHLNCNHESNDKVLDKLIKSYGFSPNLLNKYIFLISFLKTVTSFDVSCDLKNNLNNKYEELFNQILISFEQLSGEIQILSASNKKKKRFFKKRHIFALLALISFGIGFNLRKMSKKETKKSISDLRDEYDAKINEMTSSFDEQMSNLSTENQQKIEQELERVIAEYKKEAEKNKHQLKQETDRVVSQCRKERRETSERLKLHAKCVEDMFTKGKAREESLFRKIFSLPNIDFSKAFKMITGVVSFAGNVDRVFGAGKVSDLSDLEKRFIELEKPLRSAVSI